MQFFSVPFEAADTVLFAAKQKTLNIVLKIYLFRHVFRYKNCNSTFSTIFSQKIYKKKLLEDFERETLKEAVHKFKAASCATMYKKKNKEYVENKKLRTTAI